MGVSIALDPLRDPLGWLEAAGIDACDLDNRTQVRKTLIEAAKGAPRHTAVLAVSAALARVDGDIPRAIKLYRDALGENPSSALRAAILEDLITLEIGRQELQMSPTDTTLAMALADHPEHIGLRAVRAIVRAQQRDVRASDDIEDVVDAAPALPDVSRARALQRAAGAAYLIGDYTQFTRLATEAADVAQRAGANRIAARAYYQLHVYALTVATDAGAALIYATQADVAASISEDVDLKQAAMAAQYALEVESGNKLRAADLYTMRSQATHLPGYVVDFMLAIADSMVAAWDDNWDKARAILAAARPLKEEPGVLAIFNGVRALVEVALGDPSEAVRFAGLAMHFARAQRGDGAQLLRNRNLGRTLAAAALIFCGRTTRGARLLTAREFHRTANEATKQLALTIDGGHIDVLRDRAPELYGYGLLFAAVRRQVYKGDQRARLTRREIEVLILRSQGVSVQDIARQQGVVRDTIMKRQQSAVGKLEVPNVIAAISEARRRGLIS